MIKRLLTAILLLCFYAASAQDSYFVTVVKGKVTRPDGTKIATGNKLLLTDKLVFETKESLLILLPPSKGRFVVSAATAPASSSSKFTLLIKDYLQLHAQNVRLSTRGVGENTGQLVDYFNTDAEINERILIIDTLKLPVPGKTPAEVDNKENFFFLKMEYGKQSENKLKLMNAQLLITEADLKFNGKPYSTADGQLSLNYMQGFSKEKSSNQIATFTPVFLSKKQCTGIISSIRNSMPGKARGEILQEAFTQLYLMYGKPEEAVIARIYDSIK